MPPRAKERRTRIADAAIEVLAQLGARGLTHRAVDTELGLPDGSTSYYYPTRAALLLSAAERLVELDSSDVEAVLKSREGAAELVRLWLSPKRRSRSLARMELMLTAARDPAFKFMKSARQMFLDRVVEANPKRSQVAATAIMSLVDGLLLHGLVLGRASHTEVSRALESFLTPPAYNKQRGRSAAKRSKAKSRRRTVRIE
jgi:DNA-binding transcriptional regulator YbjK